MIVYGSSLSPFVRKVMVFAAEKGLEVRLKGGGFGQGGEEFAETSPFGKIPGFRDPGADGGRDFTLSDSSAIVAYLEAKHPAPPLIPADPIGRARATWWNEFADTMLFAAAQPIFFNRFVLPRAMGREGDEAAAARAEREMLPPVLEYLERTAPEAGGFLMGEGLTLADLAVVSPFVNLMHVGIYPGPDMPPPAGLRPATSPAEAGEEFRRWPRINAWVDSMLARPSFAAAMEKDRRLIGRLG